MKKINTKLKLFLNFSEYRGFTFIEVMVAVLISVVLVLVVNRFMVQSYKAITFTSEQEGAIEEARDALDLMTKEIRSANSSEQGSYALLVAEDQDFSFYSDVDNDGQKEQIRYFLDTENNELKRVLLEPGALLDYGGSGSTSTVASYINNQTNPIFVYYDSDYSEAQSINQIRLVNIQLKVNITPERAPNDYWARTDVHLRNLKDNL